MRDEKGKFVSTHGGRHTKLYNVWCAMKRRCNNPNDKRYARYGNRGIKVCEEWEHDFGAFRDWALNNGYVDGLTIDRMNNDRGYEPSNCRWVTTKVQNRNYSRNHTITYQGQTKCVTEWSEETGINAATILWRLKVGKSVAEALTVGDRRYK